MARDLRPYGAGKKRWAGMPTRLQTIAKNTLGIIMTDQMNNRTRLFRSDILDIFDQYYENTQYDDLPNWDTACESNEYVSIRKRKPRIIYNIAKVLVDKVASKLVGSAVFPNFVVEEDPDDTQFFRVVQQIAGFRRNLVDPIKHALLSGAVFVRYYLVEGSIEVEWYNAKYCYPKFDGKSELSEIEIKYVYEDPEERDPKTGKFMRKWYRMVLDTDKDVLFDNPEYREGIEPTFVEVETAEHGLGWVQGEWFRTAKHKFDPDGDSLIGDILDFIDELNYSLSQSSQAVGYNQDPQLAITKIDEDEIDKLIRSAQKAWNLGREGEAKFIESNMKGVETAEAFRDHCRHRMLEVVRVILHDPEKMVGNAQSGKALEVLNAPLVELVDELRTTFEPSLKNLLLKVGLSLLEYNARGETTVLQVADGYVPQSLDVTVQWPAIYPLTLEDLQKKAQIAQILTTAMVITRESMTRWIAQDLGIDNVEEELQKLAAEPILNPFGGGFGEPTG